MEQHVDTVACLDGGGTAAARERRIGQPGPGHQYRVVAPLVLIGQGVGVRLVATISRTASSDPAAPTCVPGRLACRFAQRGRLPRACLLHQGTHTASFRIMVAIEVMLVRGGRRALDLLIPRGGGGMRAQVVTE